jgi:BON domain
MPNQHHHDPPDGQRALHSAGGRSEGFSRQRDAEQLHAGYSSKDWERSAWPRNTRSEEERDDGSPRYDRNEPGPAARADPGRDRSGERGSFGQRLADAGRRLFGKAERIIRNPKNYRRSDERIREDVCDRFSVSPEVDSVDVKVSVSNGVVTLAGAVTTLTMKFRAEEIAGDIPGAHEVHNRLRLTRRP